MIRRAVRLSRLHRLEAISFITGFSLLTYELAAARILAPSIGSSTYVWTGVIGVIIAALSLGFYVGGRVADSRNIASDVMWILIGASVMVTGTLVFYDGMLISIVESFDDPRWQAVIAALVLFAPASFLIGTTSPYLAKMKVQSLKATGRSVASLDMFNALGGIIGTFVTGFVFFAFVGSHETIGLVALLLLAASWLLRPRLRPIRRLVISGLIVITVASPMPASAEAFSVDTPSAHYKIITGMLNGRSVRGLVTGPGGTQSAVYLYGGSEPVFWYTQQMAELTIKKDAKDVLVLGGGAFTLPQYLAMQLPDASIDVVEIDPELKDISRKYFNYRSPGNVNEIFQDARTYVNQTDKQYDVVLVDVYGDTSIPFSLITKEYGQAVAQLVKPDGVLVANIIAGQKGKCRDVFTAMDAAYRPALANALYANEDNKPVDRANHIVIYSRQFIEPGSGYKQLESFGGVAYTDNYAPAERLYFDCRQDSE